jgi:hypothetical protein
MLVSAPLVNQLTTATNDGQPSENARADCVAAACDSAAQALGRAAADTPDWWKDQAYGQGYTGATDPMHYAGVFTGLGLDISQVTAGSGAQLVQAIRDHLAERLPILGAIPSEWGLDYSGQDMAQYAGPTHEVCFCDDAGGALTAMNPWGGFYQTQPYAWWAERLVYGRVNPIWEVTTMWTLQPDGTGKDSQGHTCGTGCMAYLLSPSGQLLAGSDAILSESFRGGNDAVLPLANGHSIVAHRDPTSGQWTIHQDDAAGLGLICGLLEDARAELAAAQAKASTPAAPPASAATAVQVAGGQLLMDLIAGIHAAAQQPQ